jgi:hypothetical protein
MVNLISVLSVAGIMWVIAMAFKNHEAIKEDKTDEELVGNYVPTMSDKALEWGSRVLKADVVGRTTEKKI